jgi:hypothetical protein
MNAWRWVVMAAALIAGACNETYNTSPADGITPWPFTVDQLTLSCEPPAKVFVTTPDGRRYAVNGAARRDAPPMTEIQADSDTWPVIERGLELCRTGQGSLRLTGNARRPIASPLVRPEFTVTVSQIVGTTASAYANGAVDRQFPKLSITCGAGNPSVFVDLVRAPATPPPLQGVFGTFQVDGRPSQRFELSWTGEGGKWMLRSGGGSSRADDARLVAAMLAGREVTFTGPSTFAPSEPVTWDLSGFGEQLDAVRTLCGVRGL